MKQLLAALLALVVFGIPAPIGLAVDGDRATAVPNGDAAAAE